MLLLFLDDLQENPGRETCSYYTTTFRAVDILLPDLTVPDEMQASLLLVTDSYGMEMYSLRLIGVPQMFFTCFVWKFLAQLFLWNPLCTGIQSKFIHLLILGLIRLRVCKGAQHSASVQFLSSVQYSRLGDISKDVCLSLLPILLATDIVLIAQSKNGYKLKVFNFPLE